MRVLFCADSFPGRFGPLAAAFAASGHEVLFASHYGRRDFALPGVRRVLLKPVRVRRNAEASPGEAARLEWGRALATARLAAEAFASLRKSGFVPDIAIFSASSGAALALSRSFPEAVLIGCAEALPARASDEEAEAARLRLRTCLAQSHACIAFSQQHLRDLPPLLRREACLLPPAVDTGFFRPQAASPFPCGDEIFYPSNIEESAHSGNAAAGQAPAAPHPAPELITVDLHSVPAASSRGLWNLCAGLLAHRPHGRILMTCAEAYVREAAQAMAQALPEAWKGRVFIHDFNSLHEWRDMLCASAVHLCPEAVADAAPLPEVLEAMSCGALLALPEASAQALASFLRALPAAASATSGSAAPPSSGSPAFACSAHPENPILTEADSAHARPEGSRPAFLLPLPRTGTADQLAAICSVLDAGALRHRLKLEARRVIVSTCSQTRNVPEQMALLLQTGRRWGKSE